MRKHCKLLAALVFVLISSSSFATTYTFIGSGEWTESSNWQGSLRPTFSGSPLLADIIIAGNCTSSSVYLNLASGSTLLIKSGYSLTLHDGVFAGLNFPGSTITVEPGANLSTDAWITTGGSVIVNGTAYIGMATDNMGPITVNGTLGVGGPAHGINSYNPITVNTGGMLRIYPSGWLSASTITVNPGGTLLNQGKIFGNTTIVSSNFQNPALLSPGNSPGTITINGNYSPTSTSSHNIEVAGAAPGSYDMINVSGTVTLAGTLSVSLINGFSPSGNYSLPIVTGSPVTGTFSSVSLPAGFSLIYNSTSVVLVYGNVLPVEFLSFNATYNSTGVKLNWEVSDEQNLVGYEVEVTTDGRSYKKIGSLAAVGSRRYQFFDTSIRPKAFYRIKSIDIDGKFRFSSVINFSGRQGNIVLKAYPVPATRELLIQHPTATASTRIIVTAINGSQVGIVAPKQNSQQTKLELSMLKAGTYFICFDRGQGELQTLMFIKE